MNRRDWLEYSLMALVFLAIFDGVFFLTWCVVRLLVYGSIR